MARVINCILHSFISFFFFFNDTATTEIYTLSLHDALPIFASFSWICAGDFSRCGVDCHCRRTRLAHADSLRGGDVVRSEEHTSELQSQSNLVCRLLLEKKKYTRLYTDISLCVK